MHEFCFPKTFIYLVRWWVSLDLFESVISYQTSSRLTINILINFSNNRLEASIGRSNNYVQFQKDFDWETFSAHEILEYRHLSIISNFSNSNKMLLEASKNITAGGYCKTTASYTLVQQSNNCIHCWCIYQRSTNRRKPIVSHGKNLEVPMVIIITIKKW